MRRPETHHLRNGLIKALFIGPLGVVLWLALFVRYGMPTCSQMNHNLKGVAQLVIPAGLATGLSFLVHDLDQESSGQRLAILTLFLTIGALSLGTRNTIRFCTRGKDRVANEGSIELSHVGHSNLQALLEEQNEMHEEETKEDQQDASCCKATSSIWKELIGAPTVEITREGHTIQAVMTGTNCTTVSIVQTDISSIETPPDSPLPAEVEEEEDSYLRFSKH